MNDSENKIPDYLHRLISYSKKLSGLVGIVDFDLLQVENQNIKSNFEPICKPLESAPFIWMSKLGSITIGCFSRWRQVGDVIANSKDRLRILAYTGNLDFRKNDIIKILDGDETLIKDLNEIFNLALWDQIKNEILLATDRYGNLPLYYQYKNHRLIFATEAKAIFLISKQEISLNQEVMREILWFGCPLTEKSLFQGINKVAPATVLRFSRETTKTENYWNIKFSYYDSVERINLLGKAEQAFLCTMKQACSLSSKSAVALTGGIDTRIMLAEIMNLGVRADKFTAGLANSADMKIASRLSHFVQGKHHKLFIDNSFLEKFLKYANDTVWLGEGGILIQDNQLIYLNEFCCERFNLLIDGGCIEITKRGPLKRISRYLKPDDNLCEVLMYKWGNDQLLGMFFDSTKLRLITSRIQQTLETLLSQVKQNTIGDTIDAFFLRVVWPNRYGPQIALQNNYLASQLPFLDYKFMDAILQLPCSWREQCLFHFYVINKNAPKLKEFGRVYCDLIIPWTDNYYIRYLIPALNLVWHRLGMPSFERPNFSYRIWWRRELKEPVAFALNSFAQRGILNPKGISEILKAESINSNIYDIAASRLWMLELWCKNFLDTKEIFG